MSTQAVLQKHSRAIARTGGRLLLIFVCSALLLASTSAANNSTTKAGGGNNAGVAAGSPPGNGAIDAKCPTIKPAKTRKFFEICDASTRIERGVILLSLKSYFGLSQVAEEALESGVPVTLVFHIEVIRQRGWMWDETIATLVQRYRIQYHALTQQYVVTNLNNNASSAHNSRQIALDAISNIPRLPVIDEKLVTSNSVYYGRVCSRLAIKSLPSPLRFWAYMSSDWRLKSEWFQWQL